MIPAEPYPNSLVSAFGLLLILPLSLLALALNLFFCAVLFHGHRYFSQKFFFIVARHLQVADLVSILAQMLISVPVMALPPELARDYIDLDVVEFLLTCETLANMATFHFVALQALGQFHNLLLFQRNERAIYQLNNWGTFICILLWLWLAILLFLFGSALCAKRFSSALLTFYDSCYSEHSPKAGGYAILNIWLAILLFISFAIYLLGLWTFQRKIALVHPTSSPATQRRGSISVSIVGHPTQASLQSQMPSPRGHEDKSKRPKTMATTNRRKMAEMFKAKAALVQGFFMALTLSMRFFGFYAFPWFGTTIFGTGINVLNERAAINVMGNALILLSICVHQWVYWYWNLRVRTLCDEVKIYLMKKIRRTPT